MSWEDEALKAAQDCLQNGFALYNFQVTYVNHEPRIQVYLDKLIDPFGSPTIAECEKFSQIFDLKLSAVMQKHQLEQRYSLEVSSPGAERKIQLPEDLERFKNQPMKVRYQQNGKPIYQVLQIQSYDENKTIWKIADVKKNRKNGSYKKASKDATIELFIKDIEEVNLHLDF